MTTLREAAQQALEVLEVLAEGAEEECGEKTCPDCRAWRPVWAAITALKAALEKPEQPEQEPVAWLWEHQIDDLKHYSYKPDMRAWTTEGRIGNFERLVPVFTHPPRREWRGLKEWEINDGREQLPTEDLCNWSFRQGVYFAEKALKERNA